DLPQPEGGVQLTPTEIRIQPGRRVRLECRTDRPGPDLQVRFEDGRPVESDRRFVLSRPYPGYVIIEVPGGFDASTRRVVLDICAIFYSDVSDQLGTRKHLLSILTQVANPVRDDVPVGTAFLSDNSVTAYRIVRTGMTRGQKI
ncbi:hypothetical protein X801_08777, partial [Opisthorchis viverrini]